MCYRFVFYLVVLLGYYGNIKEWNIVGTVIIRGFVLRKNIIVGRESWKKSWYLGSRIRFVNFYDLRDWFMVFELRSFEYIVIGFLKSFCFVVFFKSELSRKRVNIY